MTPDSGSYTFILVDRTDKSMTIKTLTLYGEDARAFGQLHETAHKGKRFGKTDIDDLPHIMNNYENNFKIWKNCFGSEPTKLWQGQPPLMPIR